MSDNNNAVEIFIEDPATGQDHRFTGATETEAIAAAERFFGVEETERTAGHD